MSNENEKTYFTHLFTNWEKFQNIDQVMLRIYQMISYFDFSLNQSYYSMFRDIMQKLNIKMDQNFLKETNQNNEIFTHRFEFDNQDITYNEAFRQSEDYMISLLSLKCEQLLAFPFEYLIYIFTQILQQHYIEKNIIEIFIKHIYNLISIEDMDQNINVQIIKILFYIYDQEQDINNNKVLYLIYQQETFFLNKQSLIIQYLERYFENIIDDQLEMDMQEEQKILQKSIFGRLSVLFFYKKNNNSNISNIFRKKLEQLFNEETQQNIREYFHSQKTLQYIHETINNSKIISNSTQLLQFALQLYLQEFKYFQFHKQTALRYISQIQKIVDSQQIDYGQLGMFFEMFNNDLLQYIQQLQNELMQFTRHNEDENDRDGFDKLQKKLRNDEKKLIEISKQRMLYVQLIQLHKDGLFYMLFYGDEKFINDNWQILKNYIVQILNNQLQNLLINGSIFNTKQYPLKKYQYYSPFNDQQYRIFFQGREIMKMIIESMTLLNNIQQNQKSSIGVSIHIKNIHISLQQLVIMILNFCKFQEDYDVPLVPREMEYYLQCIYTINQWDEKTNNDFYERDDGIQQLMRRVLEMQCRTQFRLDYDNFYNSQTKKQYEILNESSFINKYYEYDNAVITSQRQQLNKIQSINQIIGMDKLDQDNQQYIFNAQEIPRHYQQVLRLLIDFFGCLKNQYLYEIEDKIYYLFDNNNNTTEINAKKVEDKKKKEEQEKIRQDRISKVEKVVDSENDDKDSEQDENVNDKNARITKIGIKEIEKKGYPLKMFLNDDKGSEQDENENDENARITKIGIKKIKKKGYPLKMFLKTLQNIMRKLQQKDHPLIVDIVNIIQKFIEKFKNLNDKDLITIVKKLCRKARYINELLLDQLNKIQSTTDEFGCQLQDAILIIDTLQQMVQFLQNINTTNIEFGRHDINITYNIAQRQGSQPQEKITKTLQSYINHEINIVQANDVHYVEVLMNYHKFVKETEQLIDNYQYQYIETGGRHEYYEDYDERDEEAVKKYEQIQQQISILQKKFTNDLQEKTKYFDDIIQKTLTYIQLKFLQQETIKQSTHPNNLIQFHSSVLQSEGWLPSVQHEKIYEKMQEILNLQYKELIQKNKNKKLYGQYQIGQEKFTKITQQKCKQIIAELQEQINNQSDRHFYDYYLKLIQNLIDMERNTNEKTEKIQLIQQFIQYLENDQLYKKLKNLYVFRPPDEIIIINTPEEMEQHLLKQQRIQYEHKQYLFYEINTLQLLKKYDNIMTEIEDYEYGYRTFLIKSFFKEYIYYQQQQQSQMLVEIQRRIKHYDQILNCLENNDFESVIQLLQKNLEKDDDDRDDKQNIQQMDKDQLAKKEKKREQQKKYKRYQSLKESFLTSVYNEEKQKITLQIESIQKLIQDQNERYNEEDKLKCQSLQEQYDKQCTQQDIKKNKDEIQILQNELKQYNDMFVISKETQKNKQMEKFQNKIQEIENQITVLQKFQQGNNSLQQKIAAYQHLFADVDKQKKILNIQIEKKQKQIDDIDKILKNKIEKQQRIWESFQQSLDLEKFDNCKLLRLLIKDVEQSFIVEDINVSVNQKNMNQIDKKVQKIEKDGIGSIVNVYESIIYGEQQYHEFILNKGYMNWCVLCKILQSLKLMQEILSSYSYSNRQLINNVLHEDVISEPIQQILNFIGTGTKWYRYIRMFCEEMIQEQLLSTTEYNDFIKNIENLSSSYKILLEENQYSYRLRTFNKDLQQYQQ